MTETVILQLTDTDKELLAPEMAAVARASETLQALQNRLTRMLMLKCPEYLREEGVEFDMERWAFVRLEPAQVPNPVEEKEHEDE
ncbi:MAG TPA: hypothetical protein VK054_04610 [Beutenbergiaceae bacterium]|nr:hypothetical protein [Beutenbergiaceae bacterium]